MKSLSSRSTSGRRSARLPGRRLCAPVAAARPRDRHTRASLGVVDLEARPGLAAAHGRRSLDQQYVRSGMFRVLPVDLGAAPDP